MTTLSSTATGVTSTDEDNINCDKADKVGLIMHRLLGNVVFSEATFKGLDKLDTLGELVDKSVKPVKSTSLDYNKLFHRLLIVVEWSQDIKSNFSRELSNEPDFLFKKALCENQRSQN